MSQLPTAFESEAELIATCLGCGLEACVQVIEALPADERAKVKGNPHGMRVKEHLKMRLRWAAMLGAVSSLPPPPMQRNGS